MAEMKFELTVLTVVRAFRPGDVIVLIPERVLSMEDAKFYKRHLKSLLDETGIKFALLPEPMRIAGREESSRASTGSDEHQVGPVT